MLLDKKLLDDVSTLAKASERHRMNFNLHQAADSKAQRLLNALEPNTILPIHRHLNTAETCILLRGRINMMLYDDNGVEVERFDLDPQKGNYGVHIPC